MRGEIDDRCAAEHDAKEADGFCVHRRNPARQQLSERSSRGETTQGEHDEPNGQAIGGSHDRVAPSGKALAASGSGSGGCQYEVASVDLVRVLDGRVVDECPNILAGWVNEVVAPRVGVLELPRILESILFDESLAHGFVDGRRPLHVNVGASWTGHEPRHDRQCAAENRTPERGGRPPGTRLQGDAHSRPAVSRRAASPMSWHGLLETCPLCRSSSRAMSLWPSLSARHTARRAASASIRAPTPKSVNTDRSLRMATAQSIGETHHPASTRQDWIRYLDQPVRILPALDELICLLHVVAGNGVRERAHARCGKKRRVWLIRPPSLERADRQGIDHGWRRDQHRQQRGPMRRHPAAGGHHGRPVVRNTQSGYRVGCGADGSVPCSIMDSMIFR